MSYGDGRVPSLPPAVEGPTGAGRRRSPSPLPGGFLIGLPRPPSVNRFVAKLGNKSPDVERWVRNCDRYIMAMRPRPQKVCGEFEVTITWDERAFGRADIDNPIKALLDYLERIELIETDRLCRRLNAGWGPASMGCIVAVKPCR
jgi:Holliday junction resolvase RusA-like endonuclease